MASLSQEVRSILDAATSAENGPAGLVFGAMDHTGRFIVAEASGKRSLASDQEVTGHLVVSYTHTHADDTRHHLSNLVDDQNGSFHCVSPDDLLGILRLNGQSA